MFETNIRTGKRQKRGLMVKMPLFSKKSMPVSTKKVKLILTDCLLLKG